MHLRALIFDLDDTLIVDQEISHHAFTLVAARVAEVYPIDSGQFIADAKRIARQRWEKGECYSFCHEIGISAFECLWGNFFGDSSEWTLLRDWALKYRQEVFYQALAAQQSEPAAGFSRDLVDEFETMRRRHQRLMPSAREVIEELSVKFKLGLLTNGAPDLQNEKIDASGLRDFFSAIVISGEHGVGKPKPAIFKKLLDLFGITPDEAMMVGNSLERDIAGAAAAGIRTVWIQVPGAEERVNPTFAIGSNDFSQYTRSQDVFKNTSRTKSMPRAFETHIETKSLQKFITSNCESRVNIQPDFTIRELAEIFPLVRENK